MLFIKRGLVVLVTICAIGVGFAQSPEEGPSEARALPGKDYAAAYVLEPSTGKTLFEDNAHTPLPTASMAKMVTLLVVADHIKSGALKLDTPVTISPRADRMGGSQIYARAGQVFTVQTLIAATMIQSANDAAEALAEKVAGTVEAFVDLMNAKARQLGLRECKFVDPHGLPPDRPGEPQDVASAHDLAVIGIEVMKVPLLREYAKTPTMPFINATFTSGLTSPNHLINPHKRDYFAVATGIKTGYSRPAGYCVTASAQRGPLELICVVMGTKNPNGPGSSFAVATRLFNEAFSRNRLMTGFHEGDVVGQVRVIDGRSKTVPAVAAADVIALVTRGEEEHYTMALSGSATAPVHRGQQMGWILIKDNGRQVGKVAALAAQDVDKQPWWRAFWPF